MLAYTPFYVFLDSGSIYFSQKCPVFCFLLLGIILFLAFFNKEFKDILFNLFLDILVLPLALLVLGIEALSAPELTSAPILWLKAMITLFPFDISVPLLSIIDMTCSDK
jgi:hypothetical protein